MFDNQILRDTILHVFAKHTLRFAQNPQNREIFTVWYSILLDLKYMSSSPRADMAYLLLEPLHLLYFRDLKEPRTDMVQYVDHGRFNELLIQAENMLMRVFVSYLKEVDFCKDTHFVKKMF